MIVKLIDQPDGALRLGELLIEHLHREPAWRTFNAAVAFVKQSGVRQLVEPIRNHVSQGGDVRISVGIDVGGTSSEGLNMLLDAVGAGGTIWVFHNDNPSTFHPKVYLFKSDDTAVVVVGSGNLSEGGLFTNYEACLAVELDLRQENDMNYLREIRRLLEHYADPENPLCKRLDRELVSRLVEAGYVFSETRARDDAEEQPGGRVRQPTGPRENLFGRAPVRGAPPVTSISTGRGERQPGGQRQAHIPQETGAEIAQDSSPVLMRYIVKAIGRDSQAHFTKATVERYFGLRPGDGKSISIQWVQPGQVPGHLESRKLVYSQSNKNPKIEMDGLKGRIPSNYPADGRAILIVRRVEQGQYRYLVLLPNDPGYADINAHLSRVPRHRQALQEDVVTLNRLLEIWPDYPV